MRILRLQTAICKSRVVVRQVKVDELVGAAEIADRFDVGVQTVHSWRRRYDDFPAPVAQLQQAMIWAWPDVERWHRRRWP